MGLTTAAFTAGIPLWQCAPTRLDGKPVSDFMLYIPGFSRRGRVYRAHAAQVIPEVCGRFGEQVLFVNLDARLGVIWVSVVTKAGLCGRVAAALQAVLPDALLVGGQLADPAGSLRPVSDSPRPRNSLLRLFSRIRRHAGRRPLPSPPDSAVR